MDKCDKQELNRLISDYVEKNNKVVQLDWYDPCDFPGDEEKQNWRKEASLAQMALNKFIINM